MAERTHKPIDGVISDVHEPTPHDAGGWRVRFKLNGAPTTKYRSDEAAARQLYDDLRTRAQANAVKIGVVPTWMTPSMVKQAELAFQILMNAKVVIEEDSATYSRLPFAAQKLVQALEAQGAPISAAEAYRLFLAKQTPRVSKKTLKDYRALLGNFIVKLGPTAMLSEVSPEQCYNYVHGLPSGPARFKAFGYMAAFFAYCRGKFNPHIRPGAKPWITASPLNFERPALKIHNIVSYTLDEIITILKVAKEKGSLGYIVFRLHSLARYDEIERFIAKAGPSFKDNQFIDLNHDRIYFDSDVYLKRSRGESRGRHVKIRPTFRAWIDYFIAHDITFAYNRWAEEQARRAIPHKFGDGFDNLIRHTALTMHLKAFDSITDTAIEGGTSSAMIEGHYLNVSITKEEAVAFHKLTPRSMGWR